MREIAPIIKKAGDLCVILILCYVSMDTLKASDVRAIGVLSVSTRKNAVISHFRISKSPFVTMLMKFVELFFVKVSKLDYPTKRYFTFRFTSQTKQRLYLHKERLHLER